MIDDKIKGEFAICIGIANKIIFSNFPKMHIGIDKDKEILKLANSIFMRGDFK